MSAGLGLNGWGKTRTCGVVSIYEDLGGRELLLQLCATLSQNFKDEMEFQFDWWRFKYLADAEIATEAARKAAEADLIFLTMQSSELSANVQRWFDNWLPNREENDGILVFVEPAGKKAGLSLPVRTFLHLVAKRARLDFLRLQVPENGVQTAGFSLPQKTPFGSRDDAHLHWGINE